MDTERELDALFTAFCLTNSKLLIAESFITRDLMGLRSG